MMEHTKEFILSALKAYWHEADKVLMRNDSGNMERNIATKQRENAKEIMDAINDEEIVIVFTNPFN
jgi:hypothetical protein